MRKAILTRRQGIHNATPARRAFTLIELLAVCVLLAIIASLALSGIGRIEGGSRLAQAEAILRDVDAKARIAALREGPVRLRLIEGRVEILLPKDPPQRADDEVMLSAPLPEEIIVDISAEAGGLDRSIQIDGAGRSVDYTFSLRDSQGSRRITVRGLIGQFVRDDGGSEH